MSTLFQILAYALRAKTVVGKRLSSRVRSAAQRRSRFYKDVWSEAAGVLGATCELLDNDVCRLRRNGASTQVRNNFTSLDDPDTFRFVNDKPRVHAELSSHGLPVPPYVEFTLNDLRPAHEFLAHHGRCVVKPAAGTGGGAGVTTGVESRRHFFLAAVRAAGYGPRLLMEPQLDGDVVRLLYLDGQLLDAVKRSPPSVLSDGKSKVSQLVRRLNETRLQAGYELSQVMVLHDLEMKRTLASQGLSWQSVPGEGQRVMLKRVTNDNMAEDNESVHDQVAEAVIVAGRHAAEALGVRLAGVDVLTPDYRQGLEAVGGVILEVNMAPGYHYHYFTRTGGRPVAVDVLKACLDEATPPPRQEAVPAEVERARES